ncbi:MAG: hypothetical protein ABI142_07540 [Bryocella sp.]
MFQFLGAWLLETEHLTIDAGHHMPNGTVLAGPVHALEDQQQRMTVRGSIEVL